MDRNNTPIQVTHLRAAGSVEIELGGQLDQPATDELRQVLETATAQDDVTIVRIDASRLELLDSTSLGLLLFFARMLRRRGGYLELTYDAPAVRRTLDVSTLGRAMRLVESGGRANRAGRAGHG